MTRSETLAVMSILKAAYPAYYRDMKRSDAEIAVNLWTEMFKDDPSQIVAAAVKAYIASDTKGFPPHIGAIKDAIIKITNPTEMTELEAWGYVDKAICNGIYGAREEFEKLPPMIQLLVGSPAQLHEWALMDSNTVKSVVASNFQRSYRSHLSRQREMLSIPADVHKAVAQISTHANAQLVDKSRLF